MTYIFFYCFISLVIGMSFTFLLFYFIEKEKLLEWSKERGSYEHSLKLIIKDLDRELGIRKDLEARLKNSEETLKVLYAKLAVSEERLSSLSSYRQKYNSINDELRIQREINIVREVEFKKISCDLEEKNLEIIEKERSFLNFEKRFSDKFEILANRVFEYNESKIDIQNRLSLDELLSPLRLQLNEFEEEIKRKFSQEKCERHTLFHEIHNLQRLNAKMAQETINLTHALKGNSKVQGNWGEVILNRVLEASGMREGHEFHTQANIRTDNGHLFHPDVIVHLPDGKDIIIDAKTSLVSYEKYFNSECDEDRKVALSNYIGSLRAHIRLLEKKDYQFISDDMKTFDSVLMFVPIESAFVLALSKEPSLLTEAIEHNIILVSPTTLLVALRIINNFWRYEYQNRHTKEIADRASRLYDKIRLFVDDINKIGQYLDKLQESYCSAKNKLFMGSGNIVGQAEKFRLFGVKIKRPIAVSKGSIVISDSHKNSSADHLINSESDESSCTDK